MVDTLRGTVEHIGLKTTRIRSLDGELLVFSNSDLTSSRIRNYKQMSTRRVAFHFGVVYGTSVDQLRQVPDIMKNIVEEVEHATFERSHFLEFADSSLNYETIFHVGSRDYELYCNVQQEINLKLAKKFEELSIDMAFPTRTLHVASMPKD